MNFAHGPDEGLFRACNHFIKDERLLIFWKIFIKVLINKIFGGEIADDKLKNVEKDEVSDDIVRESSDSFEVQEKEDGGDDPSGLFIDDSFSNQRIIISSRCADGFGDEHWVLVIFLNQLIYLIN